MEPRIQYAKTSDGVNIAYAALGSGPAIVFPSDIWGSIHLYKSEALDLGAFLCDYDELVSLGWSVIIYDGRGTGSSDRDIDDWTLGGRLRDLEAVIEGAAPERFSLCGTTQGGPAAISYAVQHGDRVNRLVLSNTFAAGSDWYALIPAFRLTQKTLRDFDDEWAFATLSLANALTAYSDSRRAGRLAEVFRAGMTPRGYVAYRNAAENIDVRALLQKVSVPTLVIHDRTWLLERVGVLAQRLAPFIMGARFVETDEAAKVIDEFLREGGLVPSPTSVLRPPPLVHGRAGIAPGTAIILFVDIVDSTALTELFGDAAFRAKARNLDVSLRNIISDNGGTCIEAKTLGDGVLAIFASARQAIEAALACGHAGSADDLPLHLGLHAGDVIREDNNVYGGAVNIAARISGLSAPSELLVSDIVRGLARTSARVSFEDRGEQSLKGVGEPVRVWAVRAGEL